MSADFAAVSRSPTLDATKVYPAPSVILEGGGPVDVTIDQVMAALDGSVVIRGNDDAMKVARHVGAEVFKVGQATYAPFTTKLD